MTQHSVTHTFKRVLSVILMMAVLLMMTPVWGLMSNSAETSSSEEHDDAPLADPEEVDYAESGSGESTDPYIISEPDHLRALAAAVNETGSTFEGVFFKLKNSIKLTGTWTSIGDDTHPFKGTFDGFGFEISGLQITASTDYQGLFGYNAGTIKNLTVSGSISGGDYVGGIAGYNTGIVEFCKNKCTVSNGGDNVGGIVGMNKTSGNIVIIKGCINEGGVKGNESVGGIVGKNEAFDHNITIEGCINEGVGVVTGGSADVGGIVGKNEASGGNITVKGCINKNQVKGDTAEVGGIVGYNSSIGAGTEVTVKNCHNTGAIFGDDNIGGVVGKNSSSGNGSKATVEASYNEGSVTGGGERVGGVVGYNITENNNNNTSTVAKCYNNGTVENNFSNGDVTGSKCWTGGVVGSNESVRGGNVTVTTCFNTGDVTGSCNSGSIYVGGVVGSNSRNSGTGNCKVEICYNTGAVTVKDSTGANVLYAGGVVGENTRDVINCYNTGAVSANPTSPQSYAGGVMGYISTPGSLTNCYNIGVLSGAYCGGVVGRHPNGTVVKCFYLDTADKGNGNTSDEDGTEKLSESNFSTQATFTGAAWVFNTDTWTMGSSLETVPDRPILAAIPEGEVPPETVCEHNYSRDWPGFNENKHMDTCRNCGELVSGDHDKWKKTAIDGIIQCGYCEKTKAGTIDEEEPPVTPDPSQPPDEEDDTSSGGSGSSSGGSGSSSGGSGSSSGDNKKPPSGSKDPTNSSDPSKGDDPSDDGEYDVRIGTEIGENAPDATISDETAETLEEEVLDEHLTKAEKSKLAQDSNYLNIILRIEALEGNVPAEDRQITEAVLADTEYTVGMYFSVDLLKLINGQIIGKITELNSPICVTFEIPEELLIEGGTFVIVRIHNGVADILEDMDDDPDTIMVLTDKFSTYSIAYLGDKEKDKDNLEPWDNPETGAPVTVIVLTVVVSAAAVTFGRKKNIIE